MHIELNMKDSLPTIRKAFDEKKLQMFVERSAACSPIYAGPCAVGVCMTEQEQAFCDNRSEYSISSLMNDEIVIVPDNEYEDFSTLQMRHDAACIGIDHENYPVRLSDFEEFLVSLEQKYGAE